MLAAAAGRGRKRAAAGSLPVAAPRRPRNRSTTTPVRGPGGRFVSGVNLPAAAVGAIDAAGVERAINIGGRVGVSKSARLRAIRAQRTVVLEALRRARAARLRDGTIKTLKDRSRQLLNQSKLTRGL